MASVIKFDNICKKVNNINLLANLSFGVAQSENLFILGKNGSGKSTLFKILMNTVIKNKGSIFINGMDFDKRKNEILPLIGYLPQEKLFDKQLNIYENLYFDCEFKKIQKSQIKDKILNLAMKLDFKKYIYYNPNSVPFEILRKISFARSIINDPDILLFDNPTYGLNNFDKQKIWDIITEFKSSKTIITISQDFNETEQYSDRVIIMHNGKAAINSNMSNINNSINDTYRYQFTFKKIVPNNYLRELKSDKNINNIISRGEFLEFSIKNKQLFFKKFKEALDYDLIDVKYSYSKIDELFKKVTA